MRRPYHPSRLREQASAAGGTGGHVNGQPSLRVYQDDALHALLSLDVGDGCVRQIYLIGDPEKLGRLRAAER
jgi:hypothetical protein